MDFKDLKYISLEGGGGKGAVYLGAIKALEKTFEKHKAEFDLVGEKKSILDYHLNAPYTRAGYPKIEGISGSSAGAITALPLALGLSSSDIETVLKGYEFEKEFMSSSLHEGKYRMVGMDYKGNAKILVAEDKWRKLGENKIAEFKFDFVEAELNDIEKTGVGSNVIKTLARGQIVSLGVKILTTGILHLHEPVAEFFRWLRGRAQLSSVISGGQAQSSSPMISLGPLQIRFVTIWDRWVNFVLSRVPSPVNLSGNLLDLGLNSLKLFLPKKIGGFIPRNKIKGSIANLIWDRGVYAGFEIREFFFRILIFALSKDTHFRRCVIEKDSLKQYGISSKEIKDLEGCMKDFKFVNKNNYELTLKKLSGFFAEYLTFERFYEITGINLSCCVSNATYGQPMYFSAYFTPNYPVIEAMGGSMSFPLAFKPLYNEANVLLSKVNESITNKFTNNLAGFKMQLNVNAKTFVNARTDKRGKLLVYYKESFSQNDFYKYQNVVLNYIKFRCELNFSLNSNLSFKSYLPYLRAVIYKNDFISFDYKNPYSKQTECYEGLELKDLCYFYYNSVFKGLHVDGGAIDNLPIAIHTYVTPQNNVLDYSKLQSLDLKNHVLALKLDNSFPQALIDDIERQLIPLTKQYNTNLKEMVDTWNQMEKDRFLSTGVPGIANALPNYSEYMPIKNILELRLKKILKEKFETDVDKAVLAKILEKLKEHYKLGEKGFTPWNKQISFLNTVLTPLQFGLEQGIIEAIEDNEHVIPLYCFGLGVFDFDLTSKKLKPLVDIANKESEKAVLNYFEVAFD